MVECHTTCAIRRKLQPETCLSDKAPVKTRAKFMMCSLVYVGISFPAPSLALVPSGFSFHRPMVNSCMISLAMETSRLTMNNLRGQRKKRREEFLAVPGKILVWIVVALIEGPISLVREIAAHEGVVGHFAQGVPKVPKRVPDKDIVVAQPHLTLSIEVACLGRYSPCKLVCRGEAVVVSKGKKDMWLWVKHRQLKWNTGKWKHGLKPAVPWVD